MQPGKSGGVGAELYLPGEQQFYGKDQQQTDSGSRKNLYYKVEESPKL
jgi:hypothetical protein